MITSGEGKYKVFLEKHQLGNGLIYILGGGEQSHIGGIVFCEPDKKPVVVKLENHYDTIVLEPIALEACKKYKIKTVVVGGVHVDDASKEEIVMLVKNCNNLIKKL